MEQETKEITLSNGKMLKIRRLGAARLIKINRSIPVVIGEGGKPHTPMETFEIGVRTICACAIDPKLTAEDNPAEDEVYFDDYIPLKDMQMLEREINEFSGLTEAAESVAPFVETATSSANST